MTRNLTGLSSDPGEIHHSSRPTVPESPFLPWLGQDRSAQGPGPSPGLFSMQVLGLVRVPLYTQKDRVGGFPNFLSNAFISTAKYQLLFALKVLNMMPEEKLAEALAAATEKQKKALEKLLPSSS